ncbi:translation initiation factor [Oceanisphaera avium]|uniref:Stress response translation initiation inhibitor YciH n=1 Tax=Oceanisphaera avium TaxID=1903694 RepID=A0A1Y0CUX5_9GAMM|nr:stress response translation initiation inhibitor YciH [Oceanisphaera avium]ART79082.1 stress response translation initiation inhibitor YciH [Oceanisphaera avium]
MSNLVYSTDPNWQTPAENSGAQGSSFPNDGILRLRRETKGRKGAGVVCIYGAPPEQIEPLAKQLKKQLGTGGAIKKGVIEIQGDRLPEIENLLVKSGHKVLKVGG